jgi:hypothetical protein
MFNKEFPSGDWCLTSHRRPPSAETAIVSSVPQIHREPELAVVFRTRNAKSCALQPGDGFSAAPALAMAGERRRRHVKELKNGNTRLSLFMGAT